MILTRIYHKIKDIYDHSSSGRYTKYLRNKGVIVGEGTIFQNPRDTEIDVSRPSLVTIGRNCFFNKDVEIYAHDWVTHVFIHAGKEFLNSTGHVTIGDNVAFGRHVMVCKGVTIGNNVFIGANSTVTKDIPSNSIAVGCPAKVIMTLDEYYEKRKQVCESEALEHAKSIYDRFGRLPVPGDFREEFIYFVDGCDVDNFPEIPIRFQLGPMCEDYIQNHKAKYRSFNSFLEAAGIKP